jgi:hypothetical protein
MNRPPFAAVSEESESSPAPRLGRAPRVPLLMLDLADSAEKADRSSSTELAPKRRHGVAPISRELPVARRPATRVPTGRSAGCLQKK